MSYNIFETDYWPVNKLNYWRPGKNWAIEIDGLILYGARSREDLQKALLIKPVRETTKKFRRVYSANEWWNN